MMVEDKSAVCRLYGFSGRKERKGDHLPSHQPLSANVLTAAPLRCI